jgi:hypothetical protein
MLKFTSKNNTCKVCTENVVLQITIVLYVNRYVLTFQLKHINLFKVTVYTNYYHKYWYNFKCFKSVIGIQVGKVKFFELVET